MKTDIIVVAMGVATMKAAMLMLGVYSSDSDCSS